MCLELLKDIAIEILLLTDSSIFVLTMKLLKG